MLDFIRIFETKSSEVIFKNPSIGANTVYVPDYFLVFLYTSVLSISGMLDRSIIALIFFYSRCWLTTFLGVLFMLFTYIPSILIFFTTEWRKSTVCKVIYPRLMYLALIILGLDSVVIGGLALMSTFTNQEYFIESMDSYLFNSHPVFHIKDKHLSWIKICCIFNSVFKSIPQLFITPLFLLMSNMNELLDYLTLISIFLNMIAFSLTIAVTFPIRKTPKIFSTSYCVILNSSCKFLASMCACGFNFVFFIYVYRSIGRYAFLAYGFRLIISIWPSWRMVKTLSYPTVNLVFYGIVFTLIFNIIYIHPFRDLGNYCYYIFYLAIFLTELVVLYVYTEADYDVLTVCFAFKLCICGLVSSFGILNDLQTIKPRLKVVKGTSPMMISPDTSHNKAGQSTNKS